ncbi:tRNA A64-2'-O-ribosylphosphate transferase [Coemansia sp. RSA 1813]|nr:tRNA A64-2'-O-ribosylphosphate transferase [Coemansia sp. RSA 1646]KAJ2086009.1 tRNA A64-2'-O-ribosylphosphate transferase [Coemansia sp. RSA 986]KAJ2563701.1 tRNA A64-2'-O-ribosylphosphate transferase [Coemansia sp. RSA 1813]
MSYQIDESKSRIDRQLRSETRNIYNRLRSIEDDAEFVHYVTQQLLPQYPVLPNERCGSWYVDPAKARQHTTVYFKSTDGHCGNWKFSLRRANTHIFDILHRADKRGCIVVDSTRSGKSMPDSFSRTIPIWCSVWNRAIHKLVQLKGDPKDQRLAMWDNRVHMPPSIVSDSELRQVDILLDSFVDKLLASDIGIAAIADKVPKPLRPIWITRDQRLVFPPDFTEATFTPIVCLSASASSSSSSSSSSVGGTQSMGFNYVQGAADDQEMWALGLTPRMFWKHRDALLLDTASACEDTVRAIVASSCDLQDNNDSARFHFIAGTQVAVGGRVSGRPPECWNHFDAIINCGAPLYQEHSVNSQKLASRYIYLPIPEGKRGQAELGKQIPRALDFARPFLRDPSKRILVHCSQGMDRSVGIALAIMTRYFDKHKAFTEENSDVSKNGIQNRLLWIITSHQRANPSRATLKQVNRFFLDIC